MRKTTQKRTTQFTKLQKIAYHEAAHVVACIRYGIPFLKVQFADDRGNMALPNGDVHTDALASVIYAEDAYRVPTSWVGTDKGDDYLLMILAVL
ncbi:MAG TPA: hypothetical protein VHZ09_04635 [Acidobacteriaceae bacterium]|nr:hypothetical protein [Acidobacteriaceae bacterium]